MFVVSLFGLAGQGVERATKELASAAVSAGLQVQAFFSSDSVHVTGMVKMDKLPVLSRQKEEADFSILFSPKNTELKPVLAGTKERGIVIANTLERIHNPLAKKRRIKVYIVDAAPFGKDQYAVLLGGLVKNFSKLSMKNLKTVVASGIAVEEGYKNVRLTK